MLGLGNILSKGGAVLQKFPNEYSFNFDGSNDDLNIGTSSAPTGNFTISCWAYSTGQGTNADNALYYGDGLTAFIAINTTGNYVQTYIGGAGGGAYTANSTITQNQWHHIAVTWDGSNTKIYIDGDNNSITGNGAGNPVSASTYIGGKPSGDTNQFKGYLDEVAIWHTALDAPTIGKISSKVVDLTKYSASNLKLWLRCGDKAEPESNTSIARADFSAEFDGSDYVAISGTGLTLNDFSISGWFYHVDNGNSYQGIIGMQDTTENDYQVGLILQFFDDYLDAEGASVDGHLPKVTANTVGSGILQNSWNHFSYTVDRDGGSGGVKLYINGVLATTDTAVDSATKANNIYIGAGYYANAVQRFFGGSSISNIAIHQTILPANDIALMAKSRFRPTRDYMLKQVDFDGSDDYITLGNADIYPDDIDAEEFLITAWVNCPVGSDGTIFSKADTSNRAIQLFTNTDDTLSGYVGGTQLDSSTVVADSTWHYVALRSFNDGGTYKGEIYIDGVFKVVGTSGTTTATDRDFLIGARRASSNTDAGYLLTDSSIASVALYSEAKDADFIYAQYAKGLFADWSADTNLSGYWKMGNGTGDVFPTIVDQSSNSNNGTITNGASDDIVQNMVAGYDLGSYNTSSVATTVDYLDFTSGTVGSTSPITAFGTNSFSISTWVNASGSYQSVFMTDTAQVDNCLILTVNMGTNIGIGDNNSWHHLTSDSAGTVANTWHLITYVREGTGTNESKFYVDGVLKDTATNNINLLSADGWKIGLGAYGFTGLIKELAVFHNKALTASEVLAQYNNGIENDFTTSGMTHHWLLNSASTVVDLVGGNNGTGSSVSLYSYYKDGNDFISPVEDTKNAIIDVSNPVLGAEINPSPDFSSSTGYYLGSRWSIDTSAGTLTYDYVDTGGESWVYKTGMSLDNAKYYKVTITLDSVGGNFSGSGMRHSVGTQDWDELGISTLGTHTLYLKPSYGEIRLRGHSVDVVISHYSIKEVHGNVGTPTSMDATNFPYTSVLPDQSFLAGENSSYGFGSFDGTNDVVTVSAINENYKSVSFWVKPTTTFTTASSGRQIMFFGTWTYGSITIGGATSHWDSDPEPHDELITMADNQGSGVKHSAWIPTGGETIPNDSWTHIAFVWDGSKYVIYYNGQPQTVTPSTGHVGLHTNKNIKIGTGNTGNIPLDGDMTGVAFWNKSLEASDILNIYNGGRHLNLLDEYSDNLITYQSFGALDSTTGLADTSSTIYDRSGNGNHGTVSGTTIQSPPNAEPEGYDIESTTRTTTIP